MSIEIKTAPKKKAVKKVAAKKPKAKPKAKPVEDDIDDLFDDKNLDNLNTEQLTDENIRAMIRARTAQAKKQERLNDVARSHLVDREQAAQEIKTICTALNEQLSNMADELVNQLYKRNKKEIRDKLVSKADAMKKAFRNILGAE